MVDALFDLEQVFRSKREQMTLKEASILKAWKARAKRDFYFGLFGGSTVTWLATRRLRNPLCTALTMGAGCVSGIWLIARSLDSSVDHILSLEGSRMQRELANIMLKKHQNDPGVKHRLSKHFYSEEVYDDSSVDRPLLRWRYRNFSGDVTRSQGTSYGEENDPKENNVKKSTAMEPKQVYASAADHARAAAHARAADDSTENPFDLIFGLSESGEDAPQPDTPPASSRRQTRKERRSRRRHRHHHHEESDEE